MSERKKINMDYGKKFNKTKEEKSERKFPEKEKIRLYLRRRL